MSVPGDFHAILRAGLLYPYNKWMINNLTPKHTPGGSVKPTDGGWRLEIPAGPAKIYRLAQLDDYAALARNRLLHTQPRELSLRARVSSADLPGTWGFGLWNDPFGFALGFGGTVRRLPALPNNAWFFHASAPNWLSIHKGVPGQGFFAGTIRSPRIPSILLAPGIVTLPFIAIRPVSKLMRRIAAHFIRQTAQTIPVDVTAWHAYSFHWLDTSVEFQVDNKPVLRTSVAPAAPLGLVIWIDNQFAAWDDGGRLSSGTMANPSAWLEVAQINTG
jgi:hypothetical protein